jgi:hypothetical protein
VFLAQKIPAANKTAQDSFLQPHTTRFFEIFWYPWGKKYTLLITAFLKHYCYCVSYILMFLQYVSFLQSSPVLCRTTFRPRSLQRVRSLLRSEQECHFSKHDFAFGVLLNGVTHKLTSHKEHLYLELLSCLGAGQ